MRGVYLLVRQDRADRADTNHVRAACADVLSQSREPVTA